MAAETPPTSDSETTTTTTTPESSSEKEVTAPSPEGSDTHAAGDTSAKAEHTEDKAPEAGDTKAAPPKAHADAGPKDERGGKSRKDGDRKGRGGKGTKPSDSSTATTSSKAAPADEKTEEKKTEETKPEEAKSTEAPKEEKKPEEKYTPTPPPRFDQAAFDNARFDAQNYSTEQLEAELKELGPLQREEADKTLKGEKAKDSFEQQERDRVNGKILALEGLLAQRYIAGAQKGEQLSPEKMRLVMHNMVTNGRTSAMEQMYLKGMNFNTWQDALNHYGVPDKSAPGTPGLKGLWEDMTSKYPTFRGKCIKEVLRGGAISATAAVGLGLLGGAVAWPAVLGGFAGATALGYIARRAQQRELFQAKDGKKSMGEAAFDQIMSRFNDTKRIADQALQKGEKLSEEDLHKQFYSIVQTMQNGAHERLEKYKGPAEKGTALQNFEALNKKWDTRVAIMRFLGQIGGGALGSGFSAWEALQAAKEHGVNMVGADVVTSLGHQSMNTVNPHNWFSQGGHLVKFSANDGHWHVVQNVLDGQAVQHNVGSHVSQNFLNHNWQFLDPANHDAATAFTPDMVDKVASGTMTNVLHAAPHADPSLQIMESAFISGMQAPVAIGIADAIGAGVVGHLSKKEREAALKKGDDGYGGMLRYKDEAPLPPSPLSSGGGDLPPAGEAGSDIKMRPQLAEDLRRERELNSERFDHGGSIQMLEGDEILKQWNKHFSEDNREQTPNNGDNSNKEQSEEDRSSDHEIRERLAAFYKPVEEAGFGDYFSKVESLVRDGWKNKEAKNKSFSLYGPESYSKLMDTPKKSTKDTERHFVVEVSPEVLKSKEQTENFVKKYGLSLAVRTKRAVLVPMALEDGTELGWKNTLLDLFELNNRIENQTDELTVVEVDEAPEPKQKVKDEVSDAVNEVKEKTKKSKAPKREVEPNIRGLIREKAEDFLQPGRNQEGGMGRVRDIMSDADIWNTLRNEEGLYSLLFTAEELAEEGWPEVTPLRIIQRLEVMSEYVEERSLEIPQRLEQVRTDYEAKKAAIDPAQGAAEIDALQEEFERKEFGYERRKEATQTFADVIKIIREGYEKALSESEEPEISSVVEATVAESTNRTEIAAEQLITIVTTWENLLTEQMSRFDRQTDVSEVKNNVQHLKEVVDRLRSEKTEENLNEFFAAYHQVKDSLPVPLFVGVMADTNAADIEEYERALYAPEETGEPSAPEDTPDNTGSGEVNVEEPEEVQQVPPSAVASAETSPAESAPVIQSPEVTVYDPSPELVRFEDTKLDDHAKLNTIFAKKTSGWQEVPKPLADVTNIDLPGLERIVYQTRELGKEKRPRASDLVARLRALADFLQSDVNKNNDISIKISAERARAIADNLEKHLGTAQTARPATEVHQGPQVSGGAEEQTEEAAAE